MAVADQSSLLPIEETRTPLDAEGVAQVVAQACASKTPVYPLGGGTRLGFGATPARTGLGLSIASLRKVIDYPARDLTITIEAGMPVAEIACHLAGQRQRLPVDVPQADRATIGGTVATSPSGPRRYRWGTLRDYVIGLQAVDGSGVVFQGGGRVVKNAAGYDLCRLLTGSMGTLAVITQVTLMVRPMPDCSALVIAPMSDWGKAEALLADMVQTRTVPSAIELLTGPEWNTEMPGGQAEAVGRLVVGFEGTQAEVDWMVDALSQRLRELAVADPTAIGGSEAESLWRRLTDFPACGEGRWTAEVRVLPSNTVACIRGLEKLDPGCSIQSHAGNGVLVVRFSWLAEEGQATIGRAREAVAMLGGSLVVVRRPTGISADRSTVWGPKTPGRAVAERIKSQFDPQGILNPGRYVFADQ